MFGFLSRASRDVLFRYNRTSIPGFMSRGPDMRVVAVGGSARSQLHSATSILSSCRHSFLIRGEKKSKKLQKTPKDTLDDDDGDDETDAAIDGLGSRTSEESVVDEAIIPDAHSKALTKPTVPDYFPELLCLPISGRPLFPRFLKPVQIRDQEVCRAIINLKKRGQAYLGAFLARDENNEKDRVEHLEDIYGIGVLAQIQQVIPGETTATVLLLPHRRIQATKIIKTDPISTVKVENLKDESYNKENPVIKAISQELIATLKDIAKLSPMMREQINMMSLLSQITNVFEDPSQLADFCAGLVGGNPQELQRILEALVVEDRLRMTLELLKKELVNVRLQYEIGKEVEDKINKRQREYYLMEQLKNIKKELGLEKDDKEALISKFRERVEKLNMPEQAKKVFDEELSKLSHLETASAEFNVTRNYLDWITQVPWGIHTKENFDVQMAATILEEDHYGLKDVKERILEFIAVGKLRGTVQGKILCLVGPPGVGKTSVGKSIARALQRNFFRFSVGGLTDVAEIKGHRRTYIGAMPGKLVQGLKNTQSENPLVLIDEIDKLSHSYQGDPASALLELLDPEQNNSFLDHYLDIPVDCSKILFVCTANVIDTIPQPLLDRMELITLPGYVTDEKVAIAERYLIPQVLKSTGFAADTMEIKRDALEQLIKYYCRESGVRNLQKHIERIIRKAALRLVKGEQTHFIIDSQSLESFVGHPVYTTDRLYETTPPGVVMGLAWTSLGGSAIYIETVVQDTLSESSHSRLDMTGKMGEVMKESATIAYTYAKSFFARHFPDNHFFRKASIHLHIPEGAIPKDGPSAGCTMTTSLISLALNRPVRPDVAMTGEITLTGKILKIGGVKEKVMAAKRSNVTRILLPEANRKDFEELPDYIRADLDVHFVDHYDQMYPLVFDVSKST